jgi:septum formation protein
MTKKQPRLILASGSPRRRELLAEAGYMFEIIVPGPNAECGGCSETGPAELVAKLAYRKAQDVIQQLSASASPQYAEEPCLVVAADTVAACQGQILGKPVHEEHARDMLHMLSGREHEVYTGLCVWPIEMDGEPIGEVVITQLKMDQLTAEEIDQYIASDQWRGKAGGFGYQDRLGWVHILEGSPSNVVGLPMETLQAVLHRLGCFPSSKFAS